jgi:CubicO group peptidase (beta-lactamase class C family)
MKYLLLSTAMFLLQSIATSQTGIAVPQMTNADTYIKNFMTQYGIPGATMAIAKDGKIVYLRSFGKADIAGTVNVQPYNIFRIASLSKQITSIAIMKLMQEGKLTMASKVFGAGGILQDHPVFAAANITDARIYNITVQQLLEHSGGWNRDLNCNPNPTTPYPYYFQACDPITWPLRVTMLTGTSNPVTKDAMIKYLLEKGLDFAPGTSYAYSNIGYLMLGRVIEKITGMSYEKYVQTSILAPLGIFDMHIGNNLLSEKQEREMEYVGNGYTNLSIYGTGQYVPWEYGGFNVNTFEAHGGWIASARDMLKLLVAVDGFSTKPDILLPATISTMVTPSATNANYAKGWNVNQYNNWWHTGAVDGTATEWVRNAGGYTWVILLNKRNITSNNFWSDLDNLGWNILAATATWPTHDLMLTPTVNATNLSVSNITTSAATISWSNGNGDNRMLLIRPAAEKEAYPLDGTDYTANTVYGSGANTGTNNFVVYNGNGSSVNVTGLLPGVLYTCRLVEYNKNTATGNNTLYLLGDNAISSFAVGKTYIFNGAGNWNDAANWNSEGLPPATLPLGSEIVIDPTGSAECVLNVPQTIAKGAKFTVKTGKKFRVTDSLTIQK